MEGMNNNDEFYKYLELKEVEEINVDKYIVVMEQLKGWKSTNI